MGKNIIFLVLIFFVSNCGFAPIYVKNTNVNFSIEQVTYKGDRELNNFLKTNLSQYKKKEADNKIFIEATSVYKKNILSKDSTGEVTNYQLEAEVTFTIKPTNRVITITEKKIMNSMADKFEEATYESSIKQTFASSISSKLSSELVVN